MAPPVATTMMTIGGTMTTSGPRGPSLAMLERKRERLMRECDPRFLERLTGGTNGPIPHPTRTLGWRWVRWIGRNCRMGEGDMFGQPPKLAAWQELLMWKLAELEDDGTRRFTFAVLSLGKGSGKSPIGGWVGAIDLAGPSMFGGWGAEGLPKGTKRLSPDVINMAATIDQADLVFDELKTTFGMGPLAGDATVMNHLIKIRSRRGKARRIPATVKRADGSKGTTLLADEMHEFTGEGHTNAYDVAAAGTGKRASGLILIMSTAGFDLSSLFGRITSRGLAGGFQRHELFVYLTADDSIDPKRWDDMIRDGHQDQVDAEIREGIRQANPLVACGIVPVQTIMTKFKDMPLYRAVRYYFNRWTSSDESWLPAGAWDGCKGTVVFDPDLPTWIGADMALKRDSAAVVLAQYRADGKLQVSSKIWYPNGELIDQEECDDYIRSVCKTHNVQWIGADEAWWPTLPTLEAEGLPIFRMPQQGRNMVVAYGRTYRLIVDKIIVHDGSPEFSDQVASAVPKSSDRGWTLRKGQHKKKIDSAPAMAAAVFATTLPPREVEAPKPKSEVF